MASNNPPRSRIVSHVHSIPTALKERLVTTGAVSRGLLRRRDSVSVFLVVTAGYLFTFLYMMTDIVVDTSAGFSASVPVDDPFSLMFQQGPGQFSFEGVAFLELGVITWAFSPLNTLIGLGIAVLVGLNLALTFLAVTQPKSCGIGASSGVFASFPALLAGSACCAPVIAIAFGIQMSSVLLTAFTWLLPASIVLLLGSLVYVAGTVDPTAV
jgi:hypothetical protein